MHRPFVLVVKFVVFFFLKKTVVCLCHLYTNFRKEICCKDKPRYIDKETQVIVTLRLERVLENAFDRCTEFLTEKNNGEQRYIQSRKR